MGLRQDAQQFQPGHYAQTDKIGAVEPTNQPPDDRIFPDILSQNSLGRPPDTP
jgi:hypothetical protein